ncbi:hypothetical protein H5T57_03170 [Candidatus Bipolaricaulota bacterium]|nr:hypothetical protein [Candidatus Bipolaricaulota bacterium]
MSSNCNSDGGRTGTLTVRGCGWLVGEGAGNYHLQFGLRLVPGWEC